jgi:outer membrane receptor protein involved in Fe transport
VAPRPEACTPAAHFTRLCQHNEDVFMNHLSRSLVGAALASILAAPTTTWAQSADATLRGNAPASSEVTAKNVATGITRRTRAGADGTYTLAGMPPGTYRVDAGPGTETVVTLTVASTATLDLGAAADVTASAVTTDEPMQEVTVTGRRLAEVRTSEVGTTISPQQIATVPQMTRNFLEFADAVPGVVFEVDAKGATSIRAGAQGTNGVNVYIDGVGQKGYVRSGVAGQSGDTQGNPFPQLAIGEYKVITSNYKAEYDQISSAAITALTRSGTNEFEAQGFGTYSTDNWRATTPSERFPNEKSESETKEYGVSFGGPIIQDRMHFFLTYEAKRYETPQSVLGGGTAPPEVVAALPESAASQLGPATIGFVEDLLFGKIDWSLTDNDRLELTAKIRDESSDGEQLGIGVAASAALNTDNDDKRYELSWKHNADRWMNEVQLTYEDTFFVPHVVNPTQTGFVYTYYDGNDSNILAVNGSDPRGGQNKGQKGWAIADNITFTDIDWAGDHTIKLGVKYKSVELTAADVMPGQPVFYFNTDAGGADAAPWKALVALPVEGFPTTVVSDDKQYGVYAQDDWELNEHFTLNLGIRWDLEENPSYLDNVTPQFVLDALNTEISPGVTYAESLGLSSDPHTAVDVNDYISNGHNRKAQKDEIQPRLGFSWDLMADQRHVIFGGAGRSYDRTLYDYLQLEQTKFALATTEVRFDSADGIPTHACTVNGVACRTWDPQFLTNPQLLTAPFNGRAGEIDLIHNDLEVPYSDQFSLGMRNRLADWNTSVAVSRVLSKNGFLFSLGNRYPTGEFWRDRSQPWGNGLPTLGSLILGRSGIETRSTQLLLSAEKPFSEESKWGATFAYTYTNAKQNRDINEHYSFDRASIADYPFIESNATAKHRVVATGSFALPWHIQLASKLTWSTPVPGTINSCLAVGTFESGAPCTPATFSADPGGTGYTSLDLQVTKNFELGQMGSMYLRLDMLNVTGEDNLVDYQYIGGGDGLIQRADYLRAGNITGVPRTLRASFGFKF